jgi:hypothetical protein
MFFRQDVSRREVVQRWAGPPERAELDELLA